MLSRFSRVLFFVTLWTVALQAPPSMGFSKQEYWNGLAFFPPRDLLDPGMEPTSPMSRIQGSRTVMGWFLPRWGRHSVTEYPEDSYWEGARLKPWLVKKLQSFKRARVGGCFHPFFGSDSIPVLSVFRHNYKGRAGWGVVGGLIVSWTITEVHQSGLVWCWHSAKSFTFKRKTPRPHCGYLISSAPPWPRGMGWPLREPGVTERAGKVPKTNVLFWLWLPLQRWHFEGSHGVLKLHQHDIKSTFEKKKKERRRNQWLRLHEATLQFSLYHW